MKTILRSIGLGVLVLAAGAAHGQAFGALQQDARVSVPSVRALGMGDAVTAVPTHETAFFVNPAQLAQVDLRRPRITLLSAAAGAGGNLRETYTFFRNDLEPALRHGIAEMRRDDPEAYRALYDEALRVGATPKAGFAAVQGPSVQLATGGLAVGAGVFGHVVTRGKLFDGGAGFPYLDLYSQADVAVPVVAAMRVPGAPFGLSAGVQATYAQRRVTAKADPLDALDPDGEKLYVLRGSAVALDAGVYARDVVVPGLDLGAAVQNLAGGAFELAYERSFALFGSASAPDDQAEIARLEARFNAREARPAVRLGAAYRLPLLPGTGLLVSRAVVSADYVGASTSEYAQPLAAGVRAGAQATLAHLVDVRVGLSQGYPSVGAGLRLPGVHVGYAFFGVEEGRRTGQLGRTNHLMQVRVGF
ncbi:MAG: hypothetical protein ACK41D_02700 [Rubricoccaceae bacterium]